MKRAWPKIFVILLLLLVAAIQTQQQLGFPKVKPLQGAFADEAPPQWSIENWLSGNFQNDFEKYHKANFGYRPDLTRLHNQIHYSIYGEVFHDGISMAKDGQLIGQKYLNAWQGLNPETDIEIEQRFKTLQSFHHYLKEKGKVLLLVLAPDKVSTYPEVFGLEPNSENRRNNYHKWLQRLKEDSIPYIDFKAHYAQIGKSSRYPLFPKTGIHWSIYGMNQAMDSIAHYLRQNSSLNPPQMLVDTIYQSQDYRKVEMDLEEAINLLYPLGKEALAYQKYRMSSGEKPRILVLSDSFFYEMYGNGLAAKFFEAPFFWYYNKRALKYDWEDAPRDPNKYDLDSLINQTDVFLLMSTTINLKDFPWAFDARLRKDLDLE